MAPSPFLWKTVACGCPLCTLCVWWSRCPLRTKQARQCAFTGKNSAAHYCSESFPASAVSPQVEDLNAKWQRYDASRDEYVRGLHAQMQGLRAPPEPSRPSCPELMRKEISRLNRQLEEKIRVCVDVRRELVAVRGARDAALERVQMLEQQILAYKDDFTSERADRERAQGRIQELEEEVASLRQQASWTQGSCPRDVSDEPI